LPWAVHVGSSAIVHSPNAWPVLSSDLFSVVQQTEQRRTPRERGAKAVLAGELVARKVVVRLEGARKGP
ncbi:MAG: hypothetical protein IJH09_06250, partial [Clostridia bacterium]|nr:hypothetical protein [Clostridia bacterium]